MKRAVLSATILGASLASGGAFAQPVTGLYIGAGAGAGSRICGADVVFGGDVGGCAVEYRTGGGGVGLGDPGRWICSGRSGGVLFLRQDAKRGLDEAGMRDGLAKGAKVTLTRPGEGDVAILRELLGAYAGVLAQTGQDDAAGVVTTLLDAPVEQFRVIRPGAAVVGQTISTE